MEIGFSLNHNDAHTHSECTVILLMQSHAISTWFEHHHNDSIAKGISCQNYTFQVQFKRPVEGSFFFLLVFSTTDSFPFCLFQIPRKIEIYKHF